MARYRHLLDGALATDPGLAAIQRRYQLEAGDERLRVEVAQEFARAVEGLQPSSTLERIRCMQLGEFTRTFLTDFKGRRHGRPFLLEPYQDAFEADVERRGDDGERLFTIAKLIVPRGCGKTGYAAAKSLHEALRRPLKTEGFFLAESKEQAARAFDFVSTWVRMSPELLELVEMTKDSLTVKETGSTLRVVSARGAAFFGTSPGFAVVDEAWVWRREEHKDLWIAAASGVNKVPDGLCLLISTPPAAGDSLLGDLLGNELAKQELVEHPHEALTIVRDEQNGILTHHFGLRDSADVEDERLWELANPAGFKSLKVLRQQREVLRSQPGMFELLHLGMLGANTAEDQLISNEAWDRCLDPGLKPPEGATVYVGVESSRGGKMVAIGVAWRSPDDRIVVASHVMAASDEPSAATERLSEWAERVDLSHVVDRLADIRDTYSVRTVALDKSELRIGKQLRQLGLNVAHVRSGSSAQKDASRRLYALVESGELAHAGNPVLREHILAAKGVVDQHERLNVYRRSQEKQIAAWYAIGFALTQMPEEESVYAQRGVLTVGETRSPLRNPLTIPDPAPRHAGGIEMLPGVHDAGSRPENGRFRPLLRGDD